MHVSSEKPQPPHPHTPHPKPQTPNPKPQTPNPKPQSPNPKPQTPNPKPQTPNSKFKKTNPKPRTQNPKPRNPNPQPRTRNSKPKNQNPNPKAARKFQHLVFGYRESNARIPGLMPVACVLHTFVLSFLHGIYLRIRRHTPRDPQIRLLLHARYHVHPCTCNFPGYTALLALNGCVPEYASASFFWRLKNVWPYCFGFFSKRPDSLHFRTPSRCPPSPSRQPHPSSRIEHCQARATCHPPHLPNKNTPRAWSRGHPKDPPPCWLVVSPRRIPGKMLPPPRNDHIPEKLVVY